MTEIEELKSKIEGFVRQINSEATPDNIKKVLVKAKAAAEEKLKELSGAPAPAAAKEEPKAKEAKKDEPKKEKEKKAKKEDKPVVATTKKKQEEEDEEWIEVKGKKYNIKDCEDAIAAAQARKERDSESSKKSKSKKPVTKAADKIGQLVNNVVDMVPASTSDKVKKKALIQLERASVKAMVDFCKTTKVSPALIKKLEDAYATAIEPIIEEIEAEIAAKG
jgi:hypothetical protein